MINISKNVDKQPITEWVVCGCGYKATSDIIIRHGTYQDASKVSTKDVSSDIS